MKAAMDTTAPPPFTDVPERIAQVIWVLCQTVTERCSLRVRTLSAAQVEYIVARLLAARNRFRRVVERIRAGKPPKAWARKARARRVTPTPRPAPMSDAEMNSGFPPPPGWKRWAREDRAAARRAARERAALEKALDTKPVPVWRALRQHVFGWLCGCAPSIWQFPGSAPASAGDLRRLLAEPEMRALLASHRCLGDCLRTVCWGLGVERSLLYPAPAVPAAPVVVEPELSGPMPAATDPAPPPIAATVPPPRPVAENSTLPQNLPGMPAAENDFFARG